MEVILKIKKPNFRPLSSRASSGWKGHVRRASYRQPVKAAHTCSGLCPGVSGCGRPPRTGVRASLVAGRRPRHQSNRCGGGDRWSAPRWPTSLVADGDTNIYTVIEMFLQPCVPAHNDFKQQVFRDRTFRIKNNARTACDDHKELQLCKVNRNKFH